MNVKKNKIPIFISVAILISSILFLALEINIETINYSLQKRIPKLIALMLTGASIGFSTLIFQTITHNNILTPNVMGLDSMYVLIQTILMFFFGSTHFLVVNKGANFLLCVIIMIILSLVLYTLLFKKGSSNILFLVLIGMICGTLFSSISSFMQVIIDPNEFLTLQNKLFASFNNVNEDILFVAFLMIFLTVIFISKDIKYLDVISLGKDQAINLGVDYERSIKKFFIIVSILISVSTALVGSITFLGFLVVNVTRQITKTYKHSHLSLNTILVSIFTLVFSQLVIERILNIQMPISVIINLIGGIYFIYLLFKESRL